MITTEVHWEVPIPYVVTDSQLNDLEKGYNNLSKDFFLFCLGVLLTLIIGTITDYNDAKCLSLWYTLSSIFFLILTVYYGVSWNRASKTTTTTIEKIKEQPTVTVSREPRVTAGSSGSSGNSGSASKKGWVASFSSE